MKLTRKVALFLLTGMLGMYFGESKVYADVPPSDPSASAAASAAGLGTYTVTDVQVFDDGSTLTTQQTFMENDQPVGPPSYSSTPATDGTPAAASASATPAAEPPSFSVTEVTQSFDDGSTMTTTTTTDAYGNEVGTSYSSTDATST